MLHLFLLYGRLLSRCSLQALLVTLSKQIKGHSIRKGRAKGPIQLPGPAAYSTWATGKREKKDKKERESLS